MTTKYYSKKQLYVAAGLSRTTFYRKLLEMQSELAERGVTRNQQLLPPDVVEYICQKVRINPASTGIRLSKDKRPLRSKSKVERQETKRKGIKEKKQKKIKKKKSVQSVPINRDVLYEGQTDGQRTFKRR